MRLTPQDGSVETIAPLDGESNTYSSRVISILCLNGAPPQNIVLHTCHAWPRGYLYPGYLLIYKRRGAAPRVLTASIATAIDVT